MTTKPMTQGDSRSEYPNIYRFFLYYKTLQCKKYTKKTDFVFLKIQKNKEIYIKDILKLIDKKIYFNFDVIFSSVPSIFL